MTDLFLGWWNLENLFDHEDAPRTDKLTRALGYGTSPYMLDQLLVSRGLLTGPAGLRVLPSTIQIVGHPPGAKKTAKPRRYNRPPKNSRKHADSSAPSIRPKSRHFLQRHSVVVVTLGHGASSPIRDCARALPRPLPREPACPALDAA